MEVKLFFRDINSAIFSFLFPVILLLIFGSVFTSDVPGMPNVRYSQYFLAGMIASGILYTAFQNLAIAVPMEREDGTLKRLRGMPMPTASYFIGKISLIVVTYTAQVTLLLTAGVLFYGVHLPKDSRSWVDFAWISLLGLASSTLLGLAFSVVPRQAKGASALVAPIVLFLQFTSGVFFVFSEVPTWMQNIASAFPLRWLTQGMRSVFLPDAAGIAEVGGGWNLGTCAAVLTVWTALGAFLALRYFRFTLRKTD